MWCLPDQQIAASRSPRRPTLRAGATRACLVLCVVVTVLHAGVAECQDGTISFVGAIVTPTCSVTLASTLAESPAGTQSCGSTRDNSVRAMRVTTTTIQPDPADPVLHYFVNYVTGGDSAARRPQLMTVSYE